MFGIRFIYVGSAHPAHMYISSETDKSNRGKGRREREKGVGLRDCGSFRLVLFIQVTGGYVGGAIVKLVKLYYVLFVTLFTFVISLSI